MFLFNQDSPSENLQAATHFAREYTLKQPLSATPNLVYYKATADVVVRFTSDQGHVAIIGDDSLVSDDELFQLFESEYEGLPAGWMQVSH
jgi:hypothetical protein